VTTTLTTHQDLRRVLYEESMRRDGVDRCDECGWWGNDVTPTEVHGHDAKLCRTCKRDVEASHAA